MPIPNIGEPIPEFTATLSDGRSVHSDQLAGRFTTLCFFGSGAIPAMADMVRNIIALQDVFDGLDQIFIGISIDPDDNSQHDDIGKPSPGVRWLWDFAQDLSKLFGAVAAENQGEDEVSFQPLTILIDPNLRVVAVHRIDDPAEHPQILGGFLDALPTMGPPRPAAPQPPVLMVPMAFEPEFCRQLVAHAENGEWHQSGFFEEKEGKTALSFDTRRKLRSDFLLQQKELQEAAHARIARRVAPEIFKAFHFRVTRLERSVIARYQQGEYFRIHRDNNTQGTAHRAFAITIPLNAGMFEGGQIRFPEFGPQTYSAPTGCALVHSCGLLHEVQQVRAGVRYAFIPIVYGAEGAQVRGKNQALLAPGVSQDRRESQPPGTPAGDKPEEPVNEP